MGLQLGRINLLNFGMIIEVGNGHTSGERCQSKPTGLDRRVYRTGVLDRDLLHLHVQIVAWRIIWRSETKAIRFDRIVDRVAGKKAKFAFKITGHGPTSFRWVGFGLEWEYRRARPGMGA